MSSGPNASPPQQQAQASSSTHVEPGHASSPVHARSHPFLSKFQPGSLAFSTSSASGIQGNRKSVDEAIAEVASQNVSQKSPTAAAANVTDALFNRRLGHLGLDEHAHAADASSSGCCSHDGKHHHHLDKMSDEDYYSLDHSHLPPISAEARRFSEQLLGQNKAWARKTEEERPGFFAKLEKQQKPQVLWIGCSDSRVPANQIVNLDPGEIFVHRNIANVVTHTDMNLLSVLEYAVDVLKVRHIIICGHYGCGGIAASLQHKQIGIIDNWLRNIKDLYTVHRKKFEALPHGSKEQQDLLTELNVIQSALNVCHTSIIQKAWSRGDELSIHGWCYRLSDGVIRNLGLCVEGPGIVEDVYHLSDEPRTANK
ncbi:hypothetical protein EDD11_003444 [Mortierella claussenii]|nr:hypothetical protein EDD11_003444 [Mortierella claussenii]